MKISVAMATYNGEKYLAEQLKSFADQTRPPDQLVVCDDQSTDSTFDILRDFQSKVDFEVVAIRNEVRLGISRNFWKAIDACTGEVIFLSDQDDVWLPEKLRKHEEVYLGDPDREIGIVFNNAEIVNDDLTPRGLTTFEEFSIDDKVRASLGTDGAFLTLLKMARITGCTASFRKDVWTHLSLPTTYIIHDEWLGLMAALTGKIIRPIQETLNLYRQHPNQALGVSETEGLAAPRKAQIRQFWIQYSMIKCADVMTLIEKMDESGIDFPYHRHRDFMIGYLAHQWRRASYSKNLFRRMPLVFIELILGNYSRYHDDLRSVLSLDIRPKYFENQHH